MCEHSVNIGVNVDENLQKEHFVCIIFCEIFVRSVFKHAFKIHQDQDQEDQTSLTGLCTATLNMYSLYSTTVQ